MGEMFKNVINLRIIYVGNGWSTPSLTSVEDDRYDYNCGSRNMFSGLTNILSLQGTTYDGDHTDKAYAHVDGGVSNPGYLH